jgi:PAS domain S-box-containing protein
MSEVSNKLEGQGEVQLKQLSANAILQEQIAGRKGAEERLSESEDHYRNVAETATDAIITTDEEGVITFVNRAAERVFAYASAELFGLKITTVMPEYLRHVHEASLKTYIATGNRQLDYWEPITLCGLRKDNNEIPVELSCSRFTKNGKHVVTCIVRDITERNQTEASLRAREAQLQTIVEGLNDGLVVSDLEGNLLHFNRAALDMHGFASLDECRLHLTEFTAIFELAGMDGAVWPVDQWPLARVLRGEKLRDLEARIRRIHTEWKRVYSYSGTLIYDAGGQSLMAVLTICDITERRAQESLLRLAAIVESSSEAIIGNTLDGTIITWNPGAARLFGYTAEEAIGRDLTIVVPPDRADEVPRLLEKIGRGESAARYETVRLNKDGTLIDVSMTVSPIHDSAGRIIGASTIARDITEQKRAEERLRESEEHYRNVAETAIDAIITTDEEGVITFVNRAAERVFGYDSAELFGLNLTMLMPRFLLHVQQASLKTYLTTGDRQLEYWEGLELTGLKKGGREIPVELSVSRFTRNAQHVLTCIVRDITERNQAQESLLRLASIVECSSDAIIGNTREGTIFTWNPGAEKLFGYSAREAIGQHMSILVPASRKHSPKILERIMRSENENYETVRVSKAGKEIDVSVTGSPIKDGGGAVIGASTIARDITERKQAQASLLRLAAIVESSSDAIIGKTLDGTIFAWNPGAEKLFGYSASEAIGRHIGIVIPADRKDEVPEILARIGRSESIETYETARLNKEGTEIDVSVTVSPITDSGGAVIGASTIARDITEQKRAEAQLKALTSDLLQSNRELQDFASVASHDLQEPLRKIQTFADDLVETELSGLNDEGRDTLKRIQNAAGRMQRLINDLLSLSRITSGAQPFVPVDLNNVACEVLSDLEVRINETGGRVDLREIPTIDAEPLQMRQLFQNLIGNALKFNSPGRAPIVRVFGELIGGKERTAGGSSDAQIQLCQITVEDNGIGFDEKYVDRIFAMFQRLHGRNEYEGTGMGLAICRRIAEHHGGSITARSTPGRGSIFTVTIPTKRIKEGTR